MQFTCTTAKKTQIDFEKVKTNPCNAGRWQLQRGESAIVLDLHEVGCNFWTWFVQVCVSLFLNTLALKKKELFAGLQRKLVRAVGSNPCKSVIFFWNKKITWVHLREN